MEWLGWMIVLTLLLFIGDDIGKIRKELTKIRELLEK